MSRKIHTSVRVSEGDSLRNDLLDKVSKVHLLLSILVPQLNEALLANIEWGAVSLGKKRMR